MWKPLFLRSLKTIIESPVLKEFKHGATCQARDLSFSPNLKKTKQKPRLGLFLASLTPSGHHLWVVRKGKKGQEKEENPDFFLGIGNES